MSGADYEQISKYFLGNGITASVRLYFQHLMLQRQLGYLLHPQIPRRDNLAIADICCGTGIWLVDLAKQMPDARLDGYDISTDQFPARGWLPKNVNLGTMNIFEQIPAHLRHTYDVVHVGLAVLVVQKDNPGALLDQLMLLLKPGGYIQWEELDLGNPVNASCNPSQGTKEMDALRDKVLGLMQELNGVDYEWVRRLDQPFRNRDFTVLAHSTTSISDDLALPWTLQQMMGATELIEALDKPRGAAKDWWEVYNSAVASIAGGASMRTDIISIVCKAPV